MFLGLDRRDRWFVASSGVSRDFRQAKVEDLRTSTVGYKDILPA